MALNDLPSVPSSADSAKCQQPHRKSRLASSDVKRNPRPFGCRRLHRGCDYLPLITCTTCTTAPPGNEKVLGFWQGIVPRTDSGRGDFIMRRFRRLMPRFLSLCRWAMAGGLAASAVCSSVAAGEGDRAVNGQAQALTSETRISTAATSFASDRSETAATDAQARAKSRPSGSLILMEIRNQRGDRKVERPALEISDPRTKALGW